MMTSVPIELNLKEMLPTIRKAVTEKSLQCYNEFDGYVTPSYCGPCAVGVCLSEKDRSYCDTREDAYAIGSMIVTGYIKAPADQIEDFIKLQRSHDRACRPNGEEKAEFIGKFEELVTTLERKYK